MFFLSSFGSFDAVPAWAHYAPAPSAPQDNCAPCPTAAVLRAILCGRMAGPHIYPRMVLRTLPGLNLVYHTSMVASMLDM